MAAWEVAVRLIDMPATGLAEDHSASRQGVKPAGLKSCAPRARSPLSSWPSSWSSRSRGRVDVSLDLDYARTVGFDAVAQDSLPRQATPDCSAAARRDSLPPWTADLLLVLSADFEIKIVITFVQER